MDEALITTTTPPSPQNNHPNPNTQIWNLMGVARTRRVSVFRHPWNR